MSSVTVYSKSVSHMSKQRAESTHNVRGVRETWFGHFWSAVYICRFTVSWLLKCDINAVIKDTMSVLHCSGFSQLTSQFVKCATYSTASSLAVSISILSQLWGIAQNSLQWVAEKQQSNGWKYFCRVYHFYRLYIWVHPERRSEGPHHVWEAWWTGNQVGIFLISVFLISSSHLLNYFSFLIKSIVNMLFLLHWHNSMFKPNNMSLMLSNCIVTVLLTAGCLIRTSVSTTSRH